jgi:transketolase
MSTLPAGIEKLAIDTIRTLSMDGVQAANSGHPGTPMALAPVAYTVWNRHLTFNPEAPDWPARDRFILSCGHASMLLYAMIHLAGIKKTDVAGKPLDEPALSLDDLRNFRQLRSPCAGHPEFGEAAGIETTTGPLGQGIANSVGMAIAAQWLAARYNRPNFDLFDYNVYALCSDGDLMEGVSSEAASLAGHLKLANVCWIYDDNKITIEGRTDLAFSEDVARRFEGFGWQTIVVEDANDVEAIDAALKQFQATDDRPTLIVVRSVIAFGAPNAADTSGAHGAPLGDEEIRLTKAAYGWPEDEKFLVPADVPAHFADNLGRRGRKACDAWHAKFADYQSQFPQEAAELKQMWSGELPDGWDRDIPVFETDAKGMASRVSSGKVLNSVAKNIPWMIGGSADLSPSNKSDLTFEGAGHLSCEDRGGRTVHFGVREHAMAAACNGLALSGLRAFGATFFVFTDYMRPSMRLAALMQLPVLYILTHDSIGVGEDGPTHQPVEHLAALRTIPGLVVFRPGDANEVAESYRAAVQLKDRPVAMVLTRQNLPTIDRQKYAPAAGAARGGYVLCDPADGPPQVILIGTGSEVSLCLAAADKLADQGIAARVVSMPSWELFDEQDKGYRDSVLPSEVKARVAVEAGVRQGWDAYIGQCGRFVGMCGFGASGPAGELMKQFGFTVENVVTEAKSALGT